MLKSALLRFLRLVFGLAVFAFGVYLTIQANIGLAPWEALSIGINLTTGIPYGAVVVITSFILVAIDFLLKEKIGFGTIANALLVGIFTDILIKLEVVPLMQSFWPGLVTLLLGQIILSVASFLYIGSAAGCGPRDSLMVALGKRLKGVPIGAIRGGMEGCVLLIGWLLGAKVGIGTVISVFGIGFFIQYTFKLLRFDVKAVVHESCIETIRNLRSGHRADFQPEAPADTEDAPGEEVPKLASQAEAADKH